MTDLCFMELFVLIWQVVAHLLSCALPVKLDAYYR